MAPGLDFARLMGEEREDLWRKLCVKDAQATTDLSLVARSRAGEHGYTIDVHSLVLRQHEWFKVLLDGSFEEGANGGAVQADEANASAASAGQATSSSRKKLIKLGVSHEALVLLVEWLYTEDLPDLSSSSIDTVVALFSAAETMELDELGRQILDDRSAWLLADEGPGHTLVTRSRKNAHLFSALIFEKLAVHPLLQDCYLTGFTWKLLEQTTAYDSDLQARLMDFLSEANGVGSHARCMRDRLMRFMTQCPRSVWNDKPETRSANEASMTIARGRWWTDEAAEILDARIPKPMPFIDREAPYVFATAQYESDDENMYDDE